MYLLTNRFPFGKFHFDAVYQAIFQGPWGVCLSAGFEEGKGGRLGSCVMGGHYPVRVVEQ